MTKTPKPVKTPEEYAENPTEHAQQVALFMWAAKPEVRAQFPELRLMFGIPNGGLRNPVTAARLRAEGAKRGVLDILLPVSRWGFHGLFVEMKAPADPTNILGNKKPQQAGKLTDEQVRFRDAVRLEGYGVAEAWTFDEARAHVLAYLSGPR